MVNGHSTRKQAQAVIILAVILFGFWLGYWGQPIAFANNLVSFIKQQGTTTAGGPAPQVAPIANSRYRLTPPGVEQIDPLNTFQAGNDLPAYGPELNQAPSANAIVRYPGSLWRLDNGVGRGSNPTRMVQQWLRTTTSKKPFLAGRILD